MAKKSPTSIYYDEDTCAFAEIVRNGEPIDWGYWYGRSGITPSQAAKLAHCIDPMRWPDDKWAQGDIAADVLLEIRRKTDYLADRSDKWDLPSLVALFGADEAPYSMKSEIHKRQAVQREAQYTKQTEEKKQSGRYTLEEAAQELAKHAGERETTMLDKLRKSAISGKLAVYLPGEKARHEYPTDSRPIIRDWYEELYWDELNAWLDAEHPRVSWRFPEPESAAAAKNPSQSKNNDWIAAARSIADEVALRRWERGEREITARNIEGEVATLLAKNSQYHGNRGPRASGTVRNQALKGWKFIQPTDDGGTNGTKE